MGRRNVNFKGVKKLVKYVPDPRGELHPLFLLGSVKHEIGGKYHECLFEYREHEYTVFYPTKESIAEGLSDDYISADAQHQMSQERIDNLMDSFRDSRYTRSSHVIGLDTRADYVGGEMYYDGVYASDL